MSDAWKLVLEDGAVFEGIRFGAPPGNSTADEDLAALKFALMLSIVFIYLLMGFLFESFILPLSIICTIPLAAIGVTALLIATGEPESGKSLITLGLLRIILGRTKRVGYFRPIIENVIKGQKDNTGSVLNN